MFVIRKILPPTIRAKLILNARNYQVTVVGGASNVGQTVCLLLRAQPSITKLIIHDIFEETPGIVIDLSHIPVESSIQGFTGDDTLDRALKNSDLVLATGGLTRTPDMLKKTWMSNNIEFIKMLSPKLAKLNPLPFIGVATEPINTLVPMAAEIMRNNGYYDPKKLFGITTIDALRAKAMYAAENSLSPRECMVPVIGGRSGKTAVPLISQAKPACEMPESRIHELVTKIRNCDNKITANKRGWSPSLSVAYGILMFTRGVLEALDGHHSKVHAFIENNDFGSSYFAGLVSLDQNGVSEMQRYTNLSQYECHLLENSIAQLRKDVLQGKKVLEYA